MPRLTRTTVEIPALTAMRGFGSLSRRVGMEILHNRPSEDLKSGPRSKLNVLLLHFWGGSADEYAPVMEQLDLQRPEVASFALSYSGTGKSSEATGTTSEQHSIVPKAFQVYDVLKLRGAIVPEKKLIICAHSMSAKVAYVLLDLLAVDDMFHDLDCSLVLLGPAPVGPLIFPPEMHEQSLHAYDTIESATWVIQNVLSGTKLDQVTVEELAKNCANMSLAAKAGWLEHGQSFDCDAYLPSIRRRWPSFIVKVLVGSQDKVETVARVAEQTMEVLKEYRMNVEQRTLDGYGHLLPLEAPGEVVKAIMDCF